MNSFASRKTEVSEKIEESLRQCQGLKDLNDCEIMELYILWSELNACETTAVLNPSRFVSHAARLRLREGFAADLTAARGDGTMWDLTLAGEELNSYDCKTESSPSFLLEVWQVTASLTC